jgi:hypothetical protein
MSTLPQLLMTPGRTGKREGETATAWSVAEPQENKTTRKEANITKTKSALTMTAGVPARERMSAERVFRDATRSYSESPLND